jgi:hypothetical protein
MKLKYIYGLVFAAMLYTSVEAYTSKVSIWNYNNAKKSSDSNMMICHDIHNWSHPLNQKQIQFFEEIIPLCKNMPLITELIDYKNLNYRI